jgi:hypothetical protein
MAPYNSIGWDCGRELCRTVTVLRRTTMMPRVRWMITSAERLELLLLSLKSYSGIVKFSCSHGIDEFGIGWNGIGDGGIDVLPVLNETR